MTDRATRQTTQDHERMMQELMMEDRLEHFFRRYAPRDSYKSDMFHRDLMMLVRAIYREATKPLSYELTKMAGFYLSDGKPFLSSFKEDGHETA